MNKLYAGAILLGLMTPFIAISAYQWGYEQGFSIGFSSVEIEANSPEALRGTDI
ncbi:hypothetical protein [Synechococcus sp. PCC 7335]|uniref:hypothetical protein n=1 Tax=Synechococcus sp. (strain ATCC 29403 / PCC 7335) TaxID=91464 RepID=UPI0002EB0468|nr:hypothetical protein [Synechococcus sp. PCC 7335]